jgi:2-oxoglutarate ferredoxin oxidoreductase subunit alpha
VITESGGVKMAKETLAGEYQEILNNEKEMFMTGNEVVAWAALAAEADFMYGYPITPQNEIMYYWAKLAPAFGRGFLQTEDEISAGFTMLGGALVGKKTFSATAGPGNILMQESISMAEMMRLPGVWIIQQRGGPSTATVIYSQQEFRLTTTGGNGEGMRLVYSTSSHQELFESTIKAFNNAWKYRFPTFVLGDGYQAKMREPVVLFNPKLRNWEIIAAEPIAMKSGVPYLERDPVHLRNTFNIEEELYDILSGHLADFRRMKQEVVEWDEGGSEKADLLVVAHGIVGRAAISAVKTVNNQGLRVKYFRPITVRPFPGEALRKIVSEEPELKILVAESAYGQLLSVVKEELYGLANTIESYLKPGLGITAEEIEEILVRLGKKEG